MKNTRIFLKDILLLSFLAATLLNCGNIQLKDESTSKSTLPKESIRIKNDDIYKGKYNEVSIGVDGNTITGVYQFYNGWDEKIKEFSQQNVFYFTGALSAAKANVVTGWPTSDQKTLGQIEFIDSSGIKYLKFILKEQPEGYASIDFTKGNGYMAKQQSSEDWMQIRIIGQDKTKLFAEPDSLKLMKGYLIKNDIVKITEVVNDNWYKFEFNPVNNESRKIIGWVRKEALLNVDPSKWQ